MRTYRKKTLISTCIEQAKEYINGRTFCSTGILKHNWTYYSDFLDSLGGSYSFSEEDSKVNILGKDNQLYGGASTKLIKISEAEFIEKTGLKVKYIKVEFPKTTYTTTKESAKEAYLRFKIAGIHHLKDESAKKLVETLNPGDKLELERDTDNFYDDWAMEVYAKPYTFIGYVESGLLKNEKLCKLKKRGLICRCEVDEVILTDHTPIVYAKAFYLDEDEF